MFEFLKILAIKRGLKRKSPERFTYSKSNNFFSQSLENTTNNEKVLIQNLGSDVITGLRWDDVNSRFEHETEIPISELSSWRLRTYRFYGGARYEYDDVWDFWKSEGTFLPARNYARGNISQALFNTLFRFRSDRVEVLRRLVEMEIEAAKNSNGLLFEKKSKSIVQLHNQFFGNKIYGHPAYEEISARFRMIIESLAASGDLSMGGRHEYFLSGKALETLSQYELDERRHRDAVKQNKRLFWITVVIAVATAIQAYSTFFQKT